MQFLKDYGFTDHDIDDLEKKYGDEDLKLFIFNQDNVIDVIQNLQEYGIKDIPKLMLERIDIFYLPWERLEELFSRYEKDSVIASLDYDAAIFDEML